MARRVTFILFHNSASMFTWQGVVSGFAEPIRESRIAPDRARHEMYKELLDVCAACEAFALGRGPDPAQQLAAFRSRFGAGPEAS